MKRTLEEIVTGPRVFTMIDPPTVEGALLDEILLVVNGDACRITEERIRRGDKRALKATRLRFRLHNGLAMIVASPEELGTLQISYPDDPKPSTWGEYALKEHDAAILGKLTRIGDGRYGGYAFTGDFPDSGNGL
ncbi:MAG TPA: hypothetical protein VFZ48_02420 [Candidatus Saccharimonadales bacterium]